MNDRILQFGTGMLLRSLVAASVDAANAAGADVGRIIAVQSTPHGCARTLNAQRGAFTLVERGLIGGVPVQRTRRIESVARAIVADDHWADVRDIISRPEIRVVVSNVTEAGFQLGATSADAAGGAPPGFPEKLADLLRVRFEKLPDAPTLFVIPTELVTDNGPRLRDMVYTVARQRELGDAFRLWCDRRVRFCSSLVDRITTGAPDAADRARLTAELGYDDALITIAEPHALWAIECDPDELRDAFPIENAPGVVVARDITFYRERKLRLLNGAHTAMAPLAVLAGIETVRDAANDATFGPFLRHLLLDELVPGSGLPEDAAHDFALAVIDRFRNPWIEHRWRVITANQHIKMRVRVVPSVVEYYAQFARVPPALALALAAHMRFLRVVERDGNPASVRRALTDSAIWGQSLGDLPGFAEAVAHGLVALERDGVGAVSSSLTASAVRAPRRPHEGRP